MVVVLVGGDNTVLLANTQRRWLSEKPVLIGRHQDESRAIGVLLFHTTKEGGTTQMTFTYLQMFLVIILRGAVFFVHGCMGAHDISSDISSDIDISSTTHENPWPRFHT